MVGKDRKQVLNTIMEVTCCNLCGSAKSTPLYEIPDFWLKNFQTRGKYVVCTDCGLLYQSPQPEVNDALYPENYAVYQGGQDLFYKWGLKKRGQWITRYKSSGRLLDIGTGRGEFLAYMRDGFGWEVLGLEPNQKVAERSRREHNLEIIPASLEQTHFPEHTFDVITLWDVLEHVDNPKGILTEIHRILRPDGLLLLRLPNYDSLDAKIFGKYWAGFDSPRHFYVFSRLTLNKMLQVTGFSIRQIGSNIGQYPNFVKSVQFLLTGKNFPTALQENILAFLKFMPLRILAMPLFLIKDLGANGSEIVVIATPLTNGRIE